MSKKKMMFLFVCIFSLLLVSACSSVSKNIYIVKDKAETKTIELHIFGNKTDAVNTKALEEILHDYMKDNENINITYESAKGDEYYELLKKRLATGNGDDIFIVNHDLILTFKEKGYLADLTNLVSEIEFHKAINGQVYEGLEVISVPSTISSFGMYCNMDLLKQYNVEVPRNRKQFLAALETFKKAGITPLCVNNDISLKTMAIGIGMSSVYRQKNVKLRLDELNNNPQKMAEQLKAGFTFVKTLIDQEYVDASLALNTEKTKDDLTQFASGAYPFMFTGAWADSRVEALNPDFAYEIHAYPILEEGEVLVVNPDIRIAVNAKGANVEEAKQFLTYFLKPEELQKFVDIQDSLSPLAAKANYENKQIATLQTYLDNKQYVIGSDDHFQFPIWSITKECVVQLLKGKDVDFVLAYMMNEHSQYIEEGQCYE